MGDEHEDLDVTESENSKKRRQAFDSEDWIVSKKMRYILETTEGGTTEESKSKFLAKLELLSGRLHRRRISRDTIASLHQQWVEEIREDFLYVVVHEPKHTGYDRVLVPGVNFESKSARSAGVAPMQVIY